MSQPLPAPTGNYTAYASTEREYQLCELCTSYGDTLGRSILPKLTPAEQAVMPSPGDPDACSHCGVRSLTTHHRDHEGR